MNNRFSISAVTLPVTDMSIAVKFYESLGFARHRGGPSADFSTFSVGSQHVNLRLCDRPDICSCIANARPLVIFRVEDVNDFYRQVTANELSPEFGPRIGDWGERYFHLCDPDGNRLSFAQLVASTSPT